MFARALHRTCGAPLAMMVGMALATVVFCGLSSPVRLYGQEEKKPESGSADPLSGEDIGERLEQLEQLTESQLNEEQKGKAKEAYDKALEYLKRADQHVEETATFQQMVDSVDETLEKAKADLAASPSDVPPSAASDASLADLEKLLGQAIDEADQAQAEVQRLNAEPGRRQTRRAAIPQLREEASQRLDELQQQLKIPPPEGQPSELTIARKSQLNAEIRAVGAEIALYDKEKEAYDATSELLRVQRDLAAQDADRADERLQQLREVVKARRKVAVEAEARRARLELARTHSSLRHLAERNQQLADDSIRLLTRIQALTDELQGAKQSLDQLSQEAADVGQRLEQIGLSEAMGILLRKRRALMPDEGQYQRSRRERADEIREAQLRLLDLDQERSQLAFLDRHVQLTIAELPSVPEDMSSAELELTIRTLLERRRELLDASLEQQDTYFETLVALNSTEGQLIAQIRAYRDYIDARILWVRSTAVLGIGDLQKSAAAARWLLDPSGWAEVGGILWRDVLEFPLLYLGFVALLAAAFAVRPRLLRRLEAVGQQAADPECRRYRPTLEALVITVLLAFIGPALVYFLAWRLHVGGGAMEFARAVQAGLMRIADVVFAVELLRQICRPHGLGDAHFGWNEHTRRILRGSLKWALLVLPLVFVTIMLMTQSEPAHQNSLARICWITGLGFVAVFTHSLITRIARTTDTRPGGRSWSAAYTTPRIWYLIGVFVPLAFIGLALAGYVYTTIELGGNMRETVLLFLNVVILGALVQRGFAIARNKIAARQAGEREEDGSGPIDVAVSRSPRLDLSSLDEQSRQLLKAIVVAATLIGLWIIWSEVIPALAILDHVRLWYADVGGAQEAITLRHLALAILILGVTVVAVRDLPAMLELLLLNRLPFDFGARYALMTVIRYSLLITGFVFAFRLIGINWAQYQWLVAAATVGLGFGLQEIFGNFVSGLILLAERPIRVGDVVTVGDITGKVTKVSMRSTVVTNWDRQEYIVPNKDFITGRVLNWTLSNAINRIVINVRTPMTCDPERAREVLLQVAREHPLAADDPPPLATLEEFGDGTLNFVLRCYLPDMENRVGTIHELHSAIYRAFRDAGIEIATPKHDIRITTAEEGVRVSSQAEAG